MSNEIDISVVVPTWNRSGDGRHAGYLEECLDSLFRQEFAGSYEILIGTEMPQKNGEMLLDVIASNRASFKNIGVDLKVLIGDANPNSGHGPTDNDLYALARGKYVTRPLADDERYYPDFLQYLFDALEEDPETVLAYGDFKNIDADGKITRECRREAFTYKRIQQDCFIGVMVLIRKSWFQFHNLQWPATKACEDWVMWKIMADLAPESAFVHVPEFLGEWRDWAGNLTQGVRDGKIEAGKDYTA